MPFIEMPQRARIAVDHQETAAAGGAGRLAGITFDPHLAGHHVFGHAGAGVAMHNHRAASLFMPAQ